MFVSMRASGQALVGLRGCVTSHVLAFQEWGGVNSRTIDELDATMNF